MAWPDKYHRHIQIVGNILLFLCLCWFGYLVAPEVSANTTTNVFFYAVILHVLLVGEKYIHKSRLQNTVWRAVAAKYPLRRPEKWFPLAGPIVAGNVKGLTYGDVYEIGLKNNTKAYITQVNALRSFFGRLNTQMGDYILSYLVVAVAFDVPTPHIFIDGRSQNRFGRKTTDLWSLSKRVSKKEKLANLEGDFSKYFDIYSADKAYLSALTIVTPDVMLALKEQGFSFDYEIHDGHLYVIHEINLANPAELDALITALQTCLDELVPQIAKHTYDDSDKELTLHTAALHWMAVGLAFRITAFYFLKAGAVLGAGIIVGGLLHNV